MNVYKAHCLVVPFPAQGHINPMIQFSRRLNHKGVQSTLVTTHFIFKTSMGHTISSIPVETISNGYDEGGISSAESMEAYMKCFRQVGPLTLRTLLWKFQASKYPIDGIIYDPQLPWALDVAKEFGLVGAAFFTQSCVVDNIAYHVHQQLIELPIPVGVEEVSIPGLTPLEPSDLPSLVYDFGSYPTCFDAMVNQFSNIDKADWIFCNTFYKLEQEVITRINYGQSVGISGLAGAVSLAGSGGGLWSIEGGNWQMAAGLIKRSNVGLHLNEEIEFISNLGHNYELNFTTGKSYTCKVTVVATPLDELNIQFAPPILIPKRKLQHTYTTFVRGLLNPAYFGLDASSAIPELVGTVEDPDIPFSSISVLKQHNETYMTYKIFSRKPMEDTLLLDRIYSVRRETIRIDWAAYPHYNAPEVFAPFILDDLHLYYVNAFENAASTTETSAVAAESVARLR